MNQTKTILHLCADIGSDSYIYRTKGYKVILVGKDIGVENFSTSEPIHGIIANPVCTEFSFAKMAHNNGVGDHEAGLFLVKHCQRIIEECKPVWYYIENPATGRLKDFLGTPDFIYEPYEFGDPWTKKTALFGNFIKPIKTHTWDSCTKLAGLYTRPNRPKPSLTFMHKSHKQFIPSFEPFNVKDDMSFRSLCSQGFAREFFKYNP
jgi:hypothetical protein